MGPVNVLYRNHFDNREPYLDVKIRQIENISEFTAKAWPSSYLRIFSRMLNLWHRVMKRIERGLLELRGETIEWLRMRRQS